MCSTHPPLNVQHTHHPTQHELLVSWARGRFDMSIRYHFFLIICFALLAQSKSILDSIKSSFFFEDLFHIVSQSCPEMFLLKLKYCTIYLVSSPPQSKTKIPSKTLLLKKFPFQFWKCILLRHLQWSGRSGRGYKWLVILVIYALQLLHPIHQELSLSNIQQMYQNIFKYFESWVCFCLVLRWVTLYRRFSRRISSRTLREEEVSKLPSPPSLDSITITRSK